MALSSDDLTTEILLRLPVKSVLKFKTVSKQWFSIASSPRFRQIHASRSRYVTGFFFRKTPAVITNIFQSQEYGFLPLIQITPRILPIIHNRSIHLISWSGGLLLFRSLPSSIGNVRDYFVCNPTTNEVKQVPLASAPLPIADSLHVSSYLAFDPRKSPHYKIVFLCLFLNEFPEIMIYSSGTETFSSPKLVKIKCHNNCTRGGYYCNDAIHWISDENNCLYYFDLNTEELKVCRPLPVPFWCSRYFGESLGHLIIVAIISSGDDSDFVVYELKNDYSGWFVKYQVSLVGMSNAFPNYEIGKTIRRYLIGVLGIITDNEDEENLMLVLQVFDVRGNYVAYSFKNKQGLILEGCRDAAYKNGDVLYSWQYIETLACV